MDALTDSLTALGSHVKFEVDITEALASIQEHDEPLSLLMLDLDNFKAFNLAVGHRQGDAALVLVGELLRDRIRSRGSGYRVGGDHFAVLLRDVSKQEATGIAEDIRVGLAEQVAGPPSLSASVGVASLPLDARTREDLLVASVYALHQAKTGGRNRVLTSKTYEERLAAPIVEEVGKKGQGSRWPYSHLLSRCRGRAEESPQARYDERGDVLTDALTGLGSHSKFHCELGELMERSERDNLGLSVVLLDLDGFRGYNHAHGHAAGDDLLLQVAEILEQRAPGFGYRYGGDEFVLLLPALSKPESAMMAESIRKEVQTRCPGPPVVTASLGLANYPVDAKTKKDLLKACDDALYMAKRGGRNRVGVSKTFEERHAPPIDLDGGWQHPHTSPRQPPPPDLSAGGAKKLE